MKSPLPLNNKTSETKIELLETFRLTRNSRNQQVFSKWLDCLLIINWSLSVNDFTGGFVVQANRPR